MGYDLLITGVYWGYNPLTNHLQSSWDIQVGMYTVYIRGVNCSPVIFRDPFINHETLGSHHFIQPVKRKVTKVLRKKLT